MNTQSLKPERKTQRRLFSMVELLVVMVIVAVLLGVGLPAFQSLAKGQGTVLAGRNLAAKLKASRSYAITKRQKVAIVFPTGIYTHSTIGLDKKFPYGSYRVCVVTGDSSPYTFQSWIDGEKWEFMPTGTLIVGLASSKYDPGVNPTPNYTPVFSSGATVKNIDATELKSGLTLGDDNPAADVPVPAIVFTPGGTSDVTQYLAITEGSYTTADGGTEVIRTNPTDPGVQISINKFTGKISFNED
jgi:type II secretory pathway pseudopilin PulG